MSIGQIIADVMRAYGRKYACYSTPNGSCLNRTEAKHEPCLSCIRDYYIADFRNGPTRCENCG